MENATREGYKKILQALRDYVETVNDNEKVLLNAANVCCEAMGNDKISTESKEKLEEILARVNGKTVQLVPTAIHDACCHSGGVSEQKYRSAMGDICLDDKTN